MKQVKNFNFLVFKVWDLETGLKQNKTENNSSLSKKRQHRKRSLVKRLGVTFNNILWDPIVCHPWLFSVWWAPSVSQHHRWTLRLQGAWWFKCLHQVVSCRNIPAQLKLSWHWGCSYFPSLVQVKMQNYVFLIHTFADPLFSCLCLALMNCWIFLEK